MGLSIHYSGKIKDTALIPELVEELKDICISLHWKYHLFDDDPGSNREINGICFSPQESEPLFFTFSAEGVLVSPVLLQCQIDPATTISVKTQYAVIEVHKAVIRLIRYLKEKYFTAFELSDEGGYWESNDEAVLQQQFDKYNFLLDMVCDALQDFKTKPGEPAESLADRLERFLRERLGRIGN